MEMNSEIIVPEKTLREEIREQRRNIERSIRTIEREKRRLEGEEIKIKKEIKKMASTNQLVYIL